MNGLSGQKIIGYEDVQTNHSGVAAKVAAGEADVGVGIEKTASIINGIDFIPLINESYDLVIMKKPENSLLIETIIQILKSSSFRQELAAISGYDLSLTGQILYES